MITEAKMDSMVSNDQAVSAHVTGTRFTERADPTTPPANTVHLYAKDKAGISSLYAINDAGTVYELPASTPTYEFPLTGTFFVATLAAGPLGVIRTSVITRCRLYVNTAPTGADIICDVKQNGSSIWGSTPANKITVAADNNVSTQTSFDTVALTKDDILTVDVNQVGSTVAGSDGVLWLATS